MTTTATTRAELLSRLRCLVQHAQDEDTCRVMEPVKVWWVVTQGGGGSWKKNCPEAIHLSEQLGVSLKGFDDLLGDKWCTKNHAPFADFKGGKLGNMNCVTIEKLPFSEHSSKNLTGPKYNKKVTTVVKGQQHSIPAKAMQKTFEINCAANLEHDNLVAEEPSTGKRAEMNRKGGLSSISSATGKKQPTATPQPNVADIFPTTKSIVDENFLLDSTVNKASTNSTEEGNTGPVIAATGKASEMPTLHDNGNSDNFQQENMAAILPTGETPIVNTTLNQLKEMVKCLASFSSLDAFKKYFVPELPSLDDCVVSMIREQQTDKDLVCLHAEAERGSH